MSGKPRRKKGETEKNYRKRLYSWKDPSDYGAEKTAAIVDSIVLENIIEKNINCGTCYHWGDNNQCFRYPKIVVTTERHRRGEHKTK